MATPQQQQQQQQGRMQQAVMEYTVEYPVNLQFPANVVSSNPKKPLRTNPNFLQFRLFEAGVPFESPVPLAQTADRLNQFVARLEQSGCYESVQVEIDQLKPKENTDQQQQQQQQQLTIKLQEKNWYRLYVGGGIRNDMNAEIGGGGSSSLNNMLAKTQFETTAGLNNLTGYLDTTSLQYTVDATSQSRWDFQHTRPLDAFINPTLLLNIMAAEDEETPQQPISKYSIGFHAALDTLDYEFTRSYKERQRRISLRLATSQMANPEMADTAYTGIEWSYLFRDIIPRRHATLPYALDASPEIAAQAGPSEKSSLTWEHRTNGIFCDSKLNPTQGLDYYTKAEIAGPPGSVGFAKVQSGGALHLPLWSYAHMPFSCSLHGAVHAGAMESLSYGGACPKPATVSDRFFVGGPLQLRGFSFAGIGPRAKKGSSTTVPQGDALGGEFFYTATMATSMTTPALDQYGIRFMAFGNVGTLAGSLPTMSNWKSIAKSSRASVGVGASAALPMGRVEATYAWPLRFGPRDTRKNIQFGLGFSFG